MPMTPLNQIFRTVLACRDMQTQKDMESYLEMRDKEFKGKLSFGWYLIVVDGLNENDFNNFEANQWKWTGFSKKQVDEDTASLFQVTFPMFDKEIQVTSTENLKHTEQFSTGNYIFWVDIFGNLTGICNWEAMKSITVKR